MRARKYYVVWEGRAPGIYDSWEEARLQVEGFPDAKYRSYDSQEEATRAFRGNAREEMALYRQMAARRAEAVNYAAMNIRGDAIAVDGACSRNPGPTEYRGVSVGTGRELFRVGPIRNPLLKWDTENWGEIPADFGRK